MVDDQKEPRETNVQGASAETPKWGFARSIVDIFGDPVKVFRRIDAGLAWWKPFIFLSVIMMILGYFMLPFHRKVMEISMEKLSAEQMQRGLDTYDKFGVIGLITVPISVLIIYLIAAAITHVVINIMSSHSSYKKTLSLVTFCGLITVVEQIIGTVVLKMRGVESIESAEDLKFSLSLAPLVGNGKGLLNAVLQSLSIFQIWYYVVFVMGIAAIFKMSRKSAIIPILPMWIITVLLIWIGGRFGGGMR